MNTGQHILKTLKRRFEFWRQTKSHKEGWGLKTLSQLDATENVLEHTGGWEPIELKASKGKSGMPICFNCGLLLEGGLSGYGAYNFCSQNCVDRAISTHKRHALRVKSRTHFITKFELWLKDDGICGICKDMVEISQASIDHILPICKGGRHIWANVQLAHFACNIAKGKAEMFELGDKSERFMQGKYLYELRRSEPEIEQETVFEEL